VETPTPAPTLNLDRPALQRLPGVNLDDRLRLVPGFSLFRRTNSLTANPTTQGVSLRGLGSTGASRTLVLWDGVPLNSPFGGWVYWTRLAPEQLERIEVTRSAATSVFGDRAMGGTVGLFSASSAVRAARLTYDGGNRGTHDLSGDAALPLGRGWAISAAARGFTTAGWLLVPTSFAGPVDQPANVRFAAATARADWTGRADGLFLRFDLLAEDRGNGTVVQRNSTGLGSLAAHYARALNAQWGLSALAFHNREEFRASFSAIAANRQSERLTSLQSVPAEGTGFAGFLRRGGSGWNLAAGGDFHRAEGYSRERLFPTGQRIGGGVQLQSGLFAQGDVKLGFSRLYGGLRRHDTGNSVFWNPSGGIAAGGSSWRLYASANRAFRAPTLNELFREFRAGNAVTLANPNLRAETLRGVETGGQWRREHWRLSFTGYYNQLGDLIVNVTRSSTPNLITRQRDNAGAATVRGLEAALSGEFGAWLAEFSWLLADSRFATGLRIPQVPRNQGNALLSWRRKGILLTGGIRASSLQFEDDVNRFALPGFAVWHLSAAQPLPHGLSARLTLENAFDREVVAGFSPTPILGAPRLIRLGIRWEFR
jgi:outer membrane receptor protein involved in Fe transport